MAEDDLYDMAERFLDAMLTSADVDVIGAARWWDRACTALETAAQSSTSWPQCVSRAAKKLQVDVLAESTSQVVADLGRRLSDPAIFAAWRTVAGRDAVYITAIARERRAARRPKKPAAAASAAPTDQGALP